jgi:hypothetical protein
MTASRLQQNCAVAPWLPQHTEKTMQHISRRSIIGVLAALPATAAAPAFALAPPVAHSGLDDLIARYEAACVADEAACDAIPDIELPPVRVQAGHHIASRQPT